MRMQTVFIHFRASISRGVSMGFGARRGSSGGGKVEPSDIERGLAEATAGEAAILGGRQGKAGGKAGRGKKGKEGKEAGQKEGKREGDGVRLCTRVASGVRDLRNLGAHHLL